MRKPLIIALLFLATVLPGESAFSENYPRPPHRDLSERGEDRCRSGRHPPGQEYRAHVPRFSSRPAAGCFLFSRKPRPYLFWMKNCKFPIDIIWFNEQKEMIFISEKTPPCKADPCPNYGPLDKNALYVIEVASGFAQKENLKLGMKVRF
ncbi:MAG: DUF192 domain-containing protein [Candidatus Manganitrophus sp.]|nr:DUF192 domain-containing protein [Candidatus Manganitrophus sp.]